MAGEEISIRHLLVGATACEKVKQATKVRKNKF